MLLDPKAAANLKIDTLENMAVVVFSVQLPTVCRLGLHSTYLGCIGDTHYPLIVGLPILIAEAAYAIRLLRHMRARQGLLSCFGKRYTPLSDARLDVRLSYLKDKYASHAPGWQFVLWARQLALIAIGEASQAHNSPLGEAAASLTVLIAALMLHCHKQPYAHRYQNRAETVFASLSILAVGIGCVLYKSNAKPGSLPPKLLENVFEWTMLGMLLGPVSVFVAWLAATGSRRAVQPSDTLLQQVLLSDDESGGVAPPSPLGEFSINASDITERNVVFRAPLFADDELSALRAILLRKQEQSPSNPKFTTDAAEERRRSRARRRSASRRSSACLRRSCGSGWPRACRRLSRSARRTAAPTTRPSCATCCTNPTCFSCPT